MEYTMITYSTDHTITTAEFIQILIDSTLAERRPIDDTERMKKMVENASIIVTAWDKDRLVGVARSISDFAYWTYLADLAVHVKYQKRGIGCELIRVTREVTGNDVIILVIAAPAAIDYYQHIGFQNMDRIWILPPAERI